MEQEKAFTCLLPVSLLARLEKQKEKTFLPIRRIVKEILSKGLDEKEGKK